MCAAGRALNTVHVASVQTSRSFSPLAGTFKVHPTETSTDACKQLSWRACQSQSLKLQKFNWLPSCATTMPRRVTQRSQTQASRFALTLFAIHTASHPHSERIWACGLFTSWPPPFSLLPSHLGREPALRVRGPVLRAVGRLGTLKTKERGREMQR